MDVKQRMETTMLAVIVTAVIMATPGYANQEVILKTNYGYSIETLQLKVFFTTDQTRIVLHLKIPDIWVGDLTPEQIAEEENVTQNPSLGLDRPRNPLDNMYHPECANILSMVQTLFDLRREARFLVQTMQREINALIWDINLSLREKRGLDSLIGLAWGFDLATAGDVDELRSLLRQVLDSTEKALTAWTVGQNIVTRIGKLTTARFDKIDALLNLARKSLIDENQHLQNLRTSDYMTQRIIIIITRELGELIAQMSEVESFYLAVKDLAHDRLSHHLIETDVLQGHLNILSYSIKFHNPKARLVYPYVHYYYTQGHVASAMLKYQDESTLAIITHVPLTIAELTAPMFIYQVHTFPLVSPDGENYHTILTKTPKYIIYNSMNSFYSITDERQNFLCNEYKPYRCLFKVPNSDMKLHAVNDNSCAMSLFSGDLNAIKNSASITSFLGLLRQACTR